MLSIHPFGEPKEPLGTLKMKTPQVNILQLIGCIIHYIAFSYPWKSVDNVLENVVE